MRKHDVKAVTLTFKDQVLKIIRYIFLRSTIYLYMGNPIQVKLNLLIQLEMYRRQETLKNHKTWGVFPSRTRIYQDFINAFIQYILNKEN